MRLACIIAILVAGCARPVPVAVSGPASAPGWEVRYNSALALAVRGSDAVVQDPVVGDLVREMLDYQQQLRNSRSGEPGVANPPFARGIVSGAMNALTEFRRKRPQADLSAYRSALEKLSSGPEPGLAREARGLLDTV